MTKRGPSKRRKKPTVAEPLFEEEAPEPLEQGKPCAYEGCPLRVFEPRQRYCVGHALAFAQIKKLQKNAAREGGTLAGIAQGAAAGLLGALMPAATNFVKSAVDDPTAFAARTHEAWQQVRARATTPPPPAPSTPAPTCWDVLGLDPKTATPEDVRRIQRELAKIYHADRKHPAVAQGKLAAINAAAQTALQQLQQ